MVPKAIGQVLSRNTICFVPFRFIFNSGGDEKDTLNKLNKRLECYIKRIKDLEDENARLNKEVT